MEPQTTNTKNLPNLKMPNLTFDYNKRDRYKWHEKLVQMKTRIN